MNSSQPSIFGGSQKDISRVCTWSVNAGLERNYYDCVKYMSDENNYEIRTAACALQQSEQGFANCMRSSPPSWPQISSEADNRGVISPQTESVIDPELVPLPGRKLPEYSPEPVYGTDYNPDGSLKNNRIGRDKRSEIDDSDLIIDIRNMRAAEDSALGGYGEGQISSSFLGKVLDRITPNYIFDFGIFGRNDSRKVERVDVAQNFGTRTDVPTFDYPPEMSIGSPEMNAGYAKFPPPPETPDLGQYYFDEGQPIYIYQNVDTGSGYSITPGVEGDDDY